MKTLMSAVLYASVLAAAEGPGAGRGGSYAPVPDVDCHAGAERRLTQSEAKALLRAASSVADHVRLAAYFKDEAAQELSAAALDERDAELAGSSLSATHCRYLAHQARRAAEHALKRAQEEEKLAEAMQDSPMSLRHHTR